MFRRKKPKRLYYPTKSRWHTKSRRRKSNIKKTRKLLKNNIRNNIISFINRMAGFIMLGIFFVVIIIILLFSSYFSITNIEVHRQDFNVDTASVSNELNQYIGKNILLFPRVRITKAIQNAFPEFSSVKVKKILPNKIQIELDQHEIVANLKVFYVLPEAELDEEEASGIVDLDKALNGAFSLDTEDEPDKGPQTIEQKSLLNKIGQAIFNQEENLELITVTIDTLTQPIVDREFVIPTERMDYIFDSMKYFNNLFDMQVESIQYFPIAREVHFTIDNGLVVWLTFEKGYKKQIDKLNIIYEAAEFNADSIAYIDLRVQEKVIYCPNNARCNRSK